MSDQGLPAALGRPPARTRQPKFSSPSVFPRSRSDFRVPQPARPARARPKAPLLPPEVPRPQLPSWLRPHRPELHRPELRRLKLRRPGPRRPALRRPSSGRPQPRWPKLRRPRLPRLLRPAALGATITWLVAGLALFTCYLHASRAVPVNADGASNALQAWDMLHGNPLLRGWTLSDVSFYTTELPQYALVELARGLTPDVVHVAAAMTYTLLVLLAAALARGRSTGLTAAARMAITAVIMAAPQAGSASYVLLLSPDHVGSAVPVLAAWLLLDRCRRRWYVPLAVTALLAAALVADDIVAITGLAPLALVGLSRAYLRATRRPAAGLRQRVRAVWFDLALAAGAALGAWGGWAAVPAVTSAGGFAVWPLPRDLAVFSQLPQNLMLTAQGLLTLFGADFTSHTLGYVSGLAIVHLAGLALAAWGLGTALRRFARRDLVVQLLAAGTVLSLAGYVLGQRPVDINTTRDFAAVLPFAAILAGRLLTTRLRRARLLPALALLSAGYAASLGQLVAAPPQPPANEQLTSWLTARGLNSGLAGYWIANSVTLNSGGQIALRSVSPAGGTIVPGSWETQSHWYRPAAQTANFIVLVTAAPGQPPYPWITDVRTAFGPAARIYYVANYTIMVWDSNLLAHLGPAVGVAGSTAGSTAAAGTAGRS